MALVVAGPGASLTFSSASGGKIRAFNNITNAANTQVAAANTSRQKITFHNPGSADIFISPVIALDSNGSNTTLTPTTSALGGTFRVYANGGTLELAGECQGAWQALAASGTTNPLTVMDSNV